MIELRFFIQKFRQWDSEIVPLITLAKYYWCFYVKIKQYKSFAVRLCSKLKTSTEAENICTLGVCIYCPLFSLAKKSRIKLWSKASKQLGIPKGLPEGWLSFTHSPLWVNVTCHWKIFINGPPHAMPLDLVSSSDAVIIQNSWGLPQSNVDVVILCLYWIKRQRGRVTAWAGGKVGWEMSLCS